ncbi:lycopene beta cyclase [Prochlorococcus sp. MIT 1307]|uniref:lycopene beta cyclase n=1 Tax=Prochlorococcus sp. MIT 1307 TaxID=3096219 RepID=UPI002A756522|nr:lycopene cyclase family protein [Prochlorococcus sp. MIT 1307]
MSTRAFIDVLVLGAGPGALAIAAALGAENLRVEVLAASNHTDPWPYTYGIWGEEVDEMGLQHLLEHRWKNTVSFFGSGASEPKADANKATHHGRDYGLFDKKKLQRYWIKQCDAASVQWHRGYAAELEIDENLCTVTTAEGKKHKARLLIDATGYEPVFLKSRKNWPIAIQTCYGVVGRFNTPPVEEGQFVLMDYRCDHLSSKEKEEPPTFLYAMDLGDGRFFLEETSLGLAPPVTLETLKSRLKQRLAHRKLELTSLEHEELGLYLPMNMPLPDLQQPVLGFGGAAAMVHPASGYMVGGLLRRSPSVAKVLAKAMRDKNASPAALAEKGWAVLWPPDLRRKQALYQFGLEKLMRFEEAQLRDFFKGFFALQSDQWYGFLTNTLSLSELVQAMWTMFVKAPWSVRWGLMGMQGRELYLLWQFLKPLN